MKEIHYDNWSVGQIAKRAGVSVATLHFYETKGLIHSLRNQGNQRRYHTSVLRRIAVIKTAQKLGVSLNEIKDALSHLPLQSSPTKADWQKLSKAWKKNLQTRIQALMQLQSQLDECIGCGCLSLKSCKLRNPDDRLNQLGSGAVLLDSENNELDV